MKTIFFLLILTTNAMALTIENPDGRFHECTPEYIFKDFTGARDINIPDGAVVCRSNFSQEEPNTMVFRANMKNVTFVEGNLDNVFIPPTPFNEVIGSSRRSFKVQNDLRDWEVDSQGRPTKVLGEDYWIEKGISVNPNEIPNEKINPGNKPLEDELKERMPR
jgi:hypothetical protein